MANAKRQARKAARQARQAERRQKREDKKTARQEARDARQQMRVDRKNARTERRQMRQKMKSQRVEARRERQTIRQQNRKQKLLNKQAQIFAVAEENPESVGNSYSVVGGSTGTTDYYSAGAGMDAFNAELTAEGITQSASALPSWLVPLAIGSLIFSFLMKAVKGSDKRKGRR